MNATTKKLTSWVLVWLLLLQNPNMARGDSEKIVYPLKEVSSLNCRYQKFSELSSDCKEDLQILHTRDYKKYAENSGWYNDYTRRYTVLWWASYKYGWDQWNGWHMWTDIATSEWTPVYAMADWEVIIAEKQIEFWNLVSIKHKINWKTIVSDYGHLSLISVESWDKVLAWDKIWEVWSTWNSTWNHLHFQIDLPSSQYYPAYYSYKTCPYTYNEISESPVCFEELQRITVDPLAFLETSGSILNDLVIIESPKVTINKQVNKVQTKITWKASEIFDKTVYTDSSFDDIVEVQKIFRDLWTYNWKIDWNYNSILETVIDYQINSKIIFARNDTWAWYWWPKTRSVIRLQYDKYLLSLKDSNNTKVAEVTTTKTIEKISREKMLTREQIEEREINEFKSKYNIEIKSSDIWNNISLWTSKKLVVNIKAKNWVNFKWNTPYPINFVIDDDVVWVFPNKFFNFTDWKRDIMLTWKKSWNTVLYVKMWNKTLQTIDLRVLQDWKSIEAKTAAMLWNWKVILWDENHWYVLFKDDKWKRLLNTRFVWEFEIKSEWNAIFCIKSWNLKDIKKLDKKLCADSEYTDNKKITYDDTVWWMLVFDYKVFDKTAKIKIISSSKKELSYLSISTSPPKWLKKDYVYYDEVIKMIKQDIVATTINKWYFQEKNWLTEKEWVDWIKNTLIKMKEESWDKNIIAIINSNLVELNKEKVSSFTSITRKDFLNKAYKYLVLNKSSVVSIVYKDLEKDDNKKANSIFDKKNTWKDKFWETYYQPNQNLTKWEWAYLLSKALDKTRNITVSVNK